MNRLIVVGLGMLLLAGCGESSNSGGVSPGTGGAAGAGAGGTGAGGTGAGGTGAGGTAGSGAGGAAGAAGSGGSGNVGGFAPAEVLAGGMFHPTQVALGDTNLYVSDAGQFGEFPNYNQPKTGGGLAIVPKAGGATTWVAKGDSITAVTATATAVYFANATQQKIFRADLDGSNVTEAVPDAGVVVDLKAFQDTLYFTDRNCTVLPTVNCGGVNVLDGTLYSAPLAGGARTELFSSVSYSFLAVDSSGIYVTDTEYPDSAYTGEVSFWSFADQGMYGSWVTDIPGGPYGIAINDTHIYFATTGNGSGVVGRAPRAGGTWETVYSDEAANKDTGPYTVALDKDNVYWTSITSQCNSSPDNDVWYRPLDLSKSPVSISHNSPACPTSLAVDDSGVYWSSFDGGAASVSRAAKR